MWREETGSIIPLGLAIICLSAVLSLIFIEQIGIQYQTMQNRQVANVLALQVATQLNKDGIKPVINLDFTPTIQATLEVVSKHLGITVNEVHVSSPDGITMDATVCTQWKSVTGITFDAAGQVCALAKARAVSAGA